MARAAGIGTELQNEKISILIQPFYQEGTAPIPVPDGVPAWMLYAALAGLGVFVILLMVVLLIRRRSKRRKKLDGVQTVQRAEEIPAPAPEGADIMEYEDGKKLGAAEGCAEICGGKSGNCGSDGEKLAAGRR